MIEGVTIVEHIRTCQNQVFKAKLEGELCILRLTSTDHRSVDQLRTELALLADLQTVTTLATIPLPFPSGRFIESVMHEGKDHNAVRFVFFEGVAAGFGSSEEGIKLGNVLGELHAAMRALPSTYELPTMENVLKRDRLIHGDFSPSNVLCANQTTLVIDFENSCYSSYEYEIANTIYMTTFDRRHRISEFEHSGFVEGLLSGYRKHGDPDTEAITESFGERVSMLRGWLDDPLSGPLSVASSTDSWKKELMEFVSLYDQGGFKSVLDRID